MKAGERNKTRTFKSTSCQILIFMKTRGYSLKLGRLHEPSLLLKVKENSHKNKQHKRTKLKCHIKLSFLKTK